MQKSAHLPVGAFGFLPITEAALDKAQKSPRVGPPLALPAIPRLGSELLQPPNRAEPSLPAMWGWHLLGSRPRSHWPQSRKSARCLELILACGLRTLSDYLARIQWVFLKECYSHWFYQALVWAILKTESQLSTFCFFK